MRKNMDIGTLSSRSQYAVDNARCIRSQWVRDEPLIIQRHHRSTQQEAELSQEYCDRSPIR